jgi:hypothetical protein
LVIDSGAAIGALYSGTTCVVYNHLYGVSPNYDPLFDPFDPGHTVGEGLIFGIPLTVAVVASSTVPAPSTCGMTQCAAVGLAVSRRRRPRRN